MPSLDAQDVFARRDMPRHRRLRVVVFVGLALGLTVAYFAVIEMLARAGIMSPTLAFLSAKATLAKSGVAPHLPNVAFVYPLLGYLPMLAFPSPLLGQAAISGIIIAGTIVFIGERVADPFMRWIARAAVLLSPVVIYLGAQDVNALLFAVLLALGVHHVARFLRTDYSIDLFIGSTLLGLTLLLDFRCAVVLIAIVTAVVLPLVHRARARAVSVGLTLAVPAVSLALGITYIDWIFVGNPVAYLSGNESIFEQLPASPEFLAAAGHPLRTLRATGTVLLFSLPITLPYFIGFALLRRGRATDTLPLIVAYASPVLFLIVAISSGLHRPTIALVAPFLFVFLFSLDAMRSARLAGAGLALGLVVSFAPFVTASGTARMVVDALLDRNTGPVADGLAPFHEIAAKLDAPGRILMDDRDLYPLVDVLPSAQRLVLPYQNEFSEAASNPAAFVRYIVIARQPNDLLGAHYPGAEFGHIRRFHEIFRVPQAIVFERTDRREAERGGALTFGADQPVRRSATARRPRPILASVLDDSTVAPHSIQPQPRSVAAFLDGMNGRVAVLVAPEFMASASGFVNELTAFNAKITQLNVARFDGRLPTGYDFIIAFAAPRDLAGLDLPLRPEAGAYAVVDPADGKDVLAVDPATEFAMLEVGSVRGTPLLAVTYHGDARAIARLEAIDSPQLATQIGPVSVVAEDGATSYDIGERLRASYAGDLSAMSVWQQSKGGCVIAALIAIMLGGRHAARRLTGKTIS